MSPGEHSRPKKVLVCRIGAFGDACMALPVVRALSSHVNVDWLLRREYHPLLRFFPDVTCGPVVFESTISGSPTDDLVRRLAASDYDALLDFSNWDIMATLARRLKTIPLRAIAYDRTRLMPLQRMRNALPWFKPFNRTVRIDRKVHRAEKWQALIRESLGCTISVDWRLPPPRPLGDPVRLFVHPHASKARKQWAIGNFADALRRVADGRSMQFTINGGRAGERAASDDLASQLRAAGHAATVVPFDPSFASLKDALELADVAVGLDSGPMHFASLLGTPTVVIFGPYSPTEIGPLWRSTAVTPAGGRGSPKNIAPRQVSDAVNQVMESLAANTHAAIG